MFAEKNAFAKTEYTKLILISFFSAIVMGIICLSAVRDLIPTLAVLAIFISVCLIILYPDILFGAYASGLIFTIIMWATNDFKIAPTNRWALLSLGGILFYVVKERKIHLLPKVGKMASSQIAFAILLYIGTLYAVSSFSPYSFLKARRFLYLNLFPFIGSFFFYDDDKKLANLFSAFAVSIIILGLITYYFYLGGFFGEESRLAGNVGELGGCIRVGRVTGFAALLIISFIALSKRNWIHKLPLFPLVAVFVYLMLHSGTRGVLVAFILSLSVLLGVVMKSKGMPLLKRIFIPFSIFLFSIGLLYVLGEALPGELKTRYLTLISPDIYQSAYRLTLIKESLRMFAKSPIIGCGTGSFYNLVGTYPHNIFLEVATHIGLLGLFIFICFITSTFLQAFKAISISANSKSNLNYTIIAATIGFIFYLTEAQFSFDLDLNGIIWFFAGFIWAVYAYFKYKIKHIKS